MMDDFWEWAHFKNVSEETARPVFKDPDGGWMIAALDGGDPIAYDEDLALDRLVNPWNYEHNVA